LELIKQLAKKDLKSYELPEEDSYLGYEFDDSHLNKNIEEVEFYVDYNPDVSRIYTKMYYPPKENKQNTFDGAFLLAA